MCVRGSVCVCEHASYTLPVCTLPWLRAVLAGVITSNHLHREEKRERKGLKAAPFCSSPALSLPQTNTQKSIFSFCCGLIFRWAHPLRPLGSSGTEGEEGRWWKGERSSAGKASLHAYWCDWMCFWGCRQSLAWIIPLPLREEKTRSGGRRNEILTAYCVTLHHPQLEGDKWPTLIHLWRNVVHEASLSVTSLFGHSGFTLFWIQQWSSFLCSF